MPRNSAGNYSLPTGNPVVSGTVIQSSWANDTMSDIASALTDSLSRSGEGGMTAPLRISDGTVAAPGLAFSNETGSGLYRASAGNYSLSLLGTQIANFQSGAVSFNGTVTSQGDGTINGNLSVTGTASIGSTASIGGNTTITTGYLRMNDGGSAATPSIQPGNDADTGIFRPTTNALGFTTGGVEKMRITEAGNVGIGTNTPTLKLQLAGDAGGMNFRIDEPTSAYTLTTGIDDTSTYWSNNSASRGYRWINGGNERMRLTSDGYLAIGTTNPAGNSLYVNGTTYLNGNTYVNGTLNVGGGATFGGNTVVTAGYLRVADGGSAASPSVQPGTDADTGMYWAGNNTLGLSTTGTARMVIDADGDVGFGLTTGIVARVDAVQSAYSAFAARGQSAGTNVDVVALKVVDLGANNFANAAYQARTHSWGYSGATTGMVLDVNGNLLIGTTSTGTTSPGIWGGQYAAASGYGRLNFVKGTASGTGSTSALVFYYNGTQVGGVSNTSTATVFGTSSDHRLKEDVQPMTGALEKLALVKPVTFKWKSSGEAAQGFIAHELQEVFPDAVTGTKDATEMIEEFDDEGRSIGQKEVPLYQGVDSSFLVATLVKAVQELKAEIDALKAAN